MGPPLRVELQGATDGLPGRVPALHVLRVEAGLAERDGGLAADVKAVGTEDDDWLRGGQLANPLRDALRVAPDRAVHDVLLPRDVGAGTRVDDLHRLAGVQHGLDLLDPDRRNVAELRLHERT